MNTTPLARQKKKDEVGFQLAPMIDITFLLLIFFMVTTKITKEKIKLDIDLPIATAAVTPEDPGVRDIINIDKDGQLFLGDRPTSEEQLRAYLQEKIANQPTLRIYVRADLETDVEVVKTVMQACAQSGALEVLFGSYK